MNRGLIYRISPFLLVMPSLSKSLSEHTHNETALLEYLTFIKVAGHHPLPIFMTFFKLVYKITDGAE